MKKLYEALEAEIVSMDEDILTKSADFTDPNTGDNGVYFPNGD